MLFDLLNFEGVSLDTGTLDELQRWWAKRKINKVGGTIQRDLPWTIKNINGQRFFVYNNNTGLFLTNTLNQWVDTPFKFESVIFDIVLNNNVTLLPIPNTTYYCWDRNVSNLYEIESTKYKKQDGVLCFYSEGDRVNYINIISDMEESRKSFEEDLYKIRMVE